MSYKITRDKYLTKDEQALLMQSLGSDRDSVMVKLALATGARASELLALEPKSITGDVVLIRGLKGSEDREIPLRPELLAEIKAVAGKTKLFEISYPRLDQIWRLIRPVAKKFHSLRHTFAINLYEKTRDVVLVKEALGHKSINNTLVYVQAVEGLDKLRKAML